MQQHKLWAVFFAVIVALAFLLFPFSYVAGWWLPRNVGSAPFQSIDWLFYLILWVTAVFFVGTEAILVYNIWKFGDPPQGRKAPYVHGNHRLEVVWTIVPAVILISLAVVQIKTWESIKYHSKMPRGDEKPQVVTVVARQWEWRIRYPNSKTMQSWETDKTAEERYNRLAAYPYEDYPQFDDVHAVNDLHCWQNNKVLVHLKTRDVLHSFFLPYLRLKQDAVPGKSIPVWFEAVEYNCVQGPDGKWKDGFNPKTNKFNDPEYVWDLACAEFCGARHSMMKGRLYVHKDRADFIKWLEQAEKDQNQHQSPAKPVTTAAR